jgi:hypothetical protein
LITNKPVVQVVAGSGSPHLLHLPHVRLDRHIEEQPGHNEITAKQEQIQDNSKQIEKENTKLHH